LGVSTQRICDKHHVLGKIVNFLTPTVTKKLRIDRFEPSYITKEKKKLKNLHKRAKKKQCPNLMKKCRSLERKIRIMSTKAQKERVRSEATLGPNNLWKAVNIAQGKSQSSYPEEMETADGKKLKTDEEKAESFRDFFKSKTEDIVRQADIKDEVYNGKRKVSGTYTNNWITTELVERTLKDCKPKRCYGFDRVPMIFLRDGAAELSPIITVLMQKILLEEKTPEEWKVARIVPLLKRGDKKLITNYRPISNLCSITKIYERLLLHRLELIEKEENVDLTGASQYGFKKNVSTETACLEIQSKIARSCDSGNFAAVASLDLTAAFDVIECS